MEETGGRIETYEGHVRRYFGGGKGAAATGTGNAFQEQGRVGGVEHGQRRVRARPGTSV